MEMMLPIELTFDNCQLSETPFFQLCQQNKNYQFEGNAQGALTMMSPTGGEIGNKNAGLSAQLWRWNENMKPSQIFDSSAGFNLSNGTRRSPAASWLRLARWAGLGETEKQRFLPLCPNFVVELLSATDQLNRPQAKPQKSLANGTRLGGLINRKSKQVEIDRRGKEIAVLTESNMLNDEDILPEFQLDPSTIW